MSNIINYMQDLGLVDFEKIRDYFFKTDIKTIQTYIEYVRELAYKDWNKAEYSPYMFVPSLDLSGFGGCSEVNCKIERALRFNKFASLYSDIIYLFVESITTPINVEITEEYEYQYRYELMCDFSIILIYSSLIKRKIARIIPPNFGICQECFNKYVVYVDQLALLEPLIQECSDKAIIETQGYNKIEQTGGITIKNLPELFHNHDGYFTIYRGAGQKIIKAISNFPSIITDKEFAHNFIKSIIHEQYFTSKYETFMSAAYQSKFITSNPSDKIIIDTISKNAIGSTPPPVFEMPFLSNIDTETILMLRESEYHAFNDYRIALDKAIKAYSDEQKISEIKDIYDDIIYPAFIKLDLMFGRTKKMRLFKTLGEFAIISSTVTVGIINSTDPITLAGITTSLCGAGALMEHISNIAERKLLSKNELESKDFYFLWQLKNK